MSCTLLVTGASESHPPQVQPGPEPCPRFVPQALSSMPVRLTPSTYWVLRLPYIYMDEQVAAPRAWAWLPLIIICHRFIVVALFCMKDCTKHFDTAESPILLFHPIQAPYYPPDLQQTAMGTSFARLLKGCYGISQVSSEAQGLCPS